jgi:hypothetical protein
MSLPGLTMDAALDTWKSAALSYDARDGVRYPFMYRCSC